MKKTEPKLYTSEEGNELTEILYTADCRGQVWGWVRKMNQRYKEVALALDEAQKRLSRIDSLLDRRITDYAECNPCPDKAAGGALSELRHIQKMIYIINAGCYVRRRR